jgi:uncharacterized protein YraI
MKQEGIQQMKRLWVLFPILAVVLAFAGFNAQPVHAQNSYANWQADFYNNAQLIDPPAFEASYPEINFDWGQGSPNGAVNVDNWSARFGADVYFAAGTYRFTIQADDGVQLWVDYKNVLSTYNAPRPGETLTVDVTLTAGTHHLQVDYREITANAYLKMTWINVNSIPNQPVGGNWTAQYYSNPNLQGAPFATVTEQSISKNWGLGAPLAGMPADNFSVRWSTTQNFPAGNYFVQVTPDDGVRVFVNGIAYINEWHLATGGGYTAGFTLPGGSTTIVVEYFEAGFGASIDFQLTVPNTNPNPTPQPSGATATVTTGALNVRNAPSAVGTTILTKIYQGQTYAITGRNAANTWLQLNVNGTIGWVNAFYVSTTNAANVPVVDGTPTQPQQPTPQPSGFIVTTVSNLNLRTGPGSNNPALLVIPRGQSATVVGRNADASWLRVTYNNVTGWVSANYVTANPPLDLSQIPVQG